MNHPSKITQHLLLVLLSLTPLAYLAAIWHQIPAVVPTHFDGAGNPNDYSPKTSLPWICLLLAGVSLLVYFILQYNHRIDPKRAGKERSATFNIIGTGVVFFMTALNFMCLQASAAGHISAKIVLVLVGLLLAFLGNFMHSVRPNFFVGIRLPWTLSSDDNWIKTHKLAGKLYFLGGLLMAAFALTLPVAWQGPAILAIIAMLVLVPSVYSFLYFRKTQRLENGQ